MGVFLVQDLVRLHISLRLSNNRTVGKDFLRGGVVPGSGACKRSCPRDVDRNLDSAPFDAALPLPLLPLSASSWGGSVFARIWIALSPEW